MSSNLYFMPSILFLISACMTVVDPETATEKTARFLTTASEPHADIFHVAGFAEPVQNTMDSVAAKTPSRDEIRLIQERMKAAGVNPGAADGVIGPKTIAALQRFQSACATLNDLLDRAGTQGLAQAVDSRELRLNAVVNETPAKDEIRLLQASLKAAGFDPGPIDGILGAKTKSRLLAVQSGCASVKNFPLTGDNQTKTEQRQALQTLPAATRSQPVASLVKKVSTPLTHATEAPSTDEIQLVQVRLKDAGFDPGPIDGLLGPRTKMAIQRYRTARGLKNSPTQSSSIGDLLIND
jgi:peptidoglycan hydrolase-like protein with peptidoglycan-binding domain